MSVKMGVHMCVVRHEEVYVCVVCVCHVLRGKRVAKCTYIWEGLLGAHT